MSEIAFKSESVEVLAAMEEWRAKRRRLNDEAGSVARELDPDGGRELLTLVSGLQIYSPGLKALDGDTDNPPHGWRTKWIAVRGGSEMALVPDKRTKVGKAAAETLAGLRSSAVPTLPGMPTETWEHRDSNRFTIHYPHIVEFEGGILVRWGADPRECGFQGPAAEAVGAQWEEVRLSVFYLAAESLEDKENSNA